MNAALASLVPIALSCGQQIQSTRKEIKPYLSRRPVRQLPDKPLKEIIAELPYRFQNIDVRKMYDVGESVAYKFINTCLEKKLIIKCNRCLYMSAELAKIDPPKRKYLGVTLVKSGKYEASIRKNGKNTYIGVFELAKDAAKAYDKEARLLGRKTNFKGC